MGAVMEKPRIKVSRLAVGYYCCTNQESNGWGNTPEAAFDDWMVAVERLNTQRRLGGMAAVTRRNRWEALKDPEAYAKRRGDAEKQWIEKQAAYANPPQQFVQVSDETGPGFLQRLFGFH